MEKILTRKPLPEELGLETTIRPRTLDEFIGQENLKYKLKIYIEAAKKRKQPLEHCLFHSPPGLGKTTLAHIIANELNVNVKPTSGPALERVGDLAAILNSLSDGDVFFIDEIHRLNHLVEETLYRVMEEFKIDLVLGKGASAHTIQLPLPRITIIGATTRSGLLTSALRERFGIIETIPFYPPEDIKKIILRSAKILNIEITDTAAKILSYRSRATPRIANRLLKRARDFAEVEFNGKITDEVVEKTMSSLGIDEYGLDETDRLILRTIAEKFSGGPVGLDTLATAIAEEVDTISEVYEPYLIQAGFLMRTPRGRVITDFARKQLNL